MKLIGLSVGLLMLSCFNCLRAGEAEQTPPRSEEAVHKTMDEIVAAEDRNDVDALDRLYVSDYTFVTPAGQVWNKGRYLGFMRSGDLTQGSYSRDEETIRLYGDTAVVIYRSTAQGTLKGVAFNSQRRVTTVLMKEGGVWRALGRQSTPILQQK
ncbi:MAG: nuclear transport factor 2 family protein [Chthoniobacterales bacterium]|jgi:ketosteroid isomerase-like protein